MVIILAMKIGVIVIMIDKGLNSHQSQIKQYMETMLWLQLKLSNSFTDIRKVSTTLGQIHQKGGPSGKQNSLSSFPPLIQIDARKEICT